MSEVRLLHHAVEKSYDTFPTDQFTNGIRVGLRQMGVPLLWAAGFDGTGITVGVIDTGIDGSHPDLVGQLLSERDYVQDGVAPKDYHFHGTHVAGIIAANGQLKGVAPGAKLISYRVLGKDGSGTYAHIIQALYDALADGCDVVNMSLGGPDDLPELHAAIQAVTKRIPVDVAVGNEGPNHISYPGFYPEVIGVGAVDSKLNVALFSNTNIEVDVACPGVYIMSCAPGGGYMIASGTSMGCPHKAGFDALLLQRGKARLGYPMSEPAIWEAGKGFTADIGTLGIDAQTGAGFVTIYPSLPVIRRVQVTKDSNTMLIDGNPVILDVPARIEEGRFLVPFRAPFEAAYGVVSWNETEHTATADFIHIPGTEI